MALPADDKVSRLIGLLDKAEAKIRDALIGALLATTSRTSLEELAILIETGRFNEAVEAAASAGSLVLAEEYIAVYTLAGRSAAGFMSEALEIVVGFDQVNFRAVNVMQQERLRLITNFTEEQRAATRLALVDGIQRGLNPIEQARNFRGSIGLTEKQQLAVIRYRELLEKGSLQALNRELRDRRFDPTVRTAAREGVAIPQQSIDRMVDRYRDRSLRFRSETIARTEALRAVHQGNNEAFQQAIDGGVLDIDQLERTWISARDKRVRESHRRLHGQKRRMDEDFKLSLRFPGDPRAPAREVIKCRCVVTTRITKLIVDFP